jgi:hypothetical protein
MSYFNSSEIRRNRLARTSLVTPEDSIDRVLYGEQHGEQAGFESLDDDRARVGNVGVSANVAQNPGPDAGTIGCARCPARWGGLKTAHCGACHRTFSVQSASDLHRLGPHSGTRRCVDPATVGLVDAGRAYRCWGHRGRHLDDEEGVAT